MSATRDEVLRAMAEAIDPHNCNWASGLPGPLKGQALRQAERALAAAEQAGWRLVPVEPTEEMIEEGCGIDCTRTVCRARLECRDASGQATMREKWAAMLAAAPKVAP